MKAEFRQAMDKGFASQLTRKNMEPYYRELGIAWDQRLFNRNWGEFDNYEILVNSVPVGILRLSHDHLSYYIRDLQIDRRWQCNGLGEKAIEYSVEIARHAEVELLRLRVFCMNPAVSLYERMGFKILKTEDDMHYMEREVLYK
ncbi:GNAT family N-acetyltransferase [Halomonas sp. I1]|uniref:GNAT family N-acetyltransferase n=1 Tax=Halomonas sp. I1 TaxID=393536 RepID=UPI0028E02D3D|nr:GNAT family N-acetyltransferase [Halomonas sp. I1]MDT8894033.1 GNAT family N-acetyltransferase [Halomonas sp. I1]